MGYDLNLNPLLERCNNDDLDILVGYIMNKGTLSETLSIKDEYKKFQPEHTRYTDLIADEIKRFGGDTIANMIRGEGPSYKEIVCDVASKLGVKKAHTMDIEEAEQALIYKVIEKSWEKMSEQDKQDFFLNIKDEIMLLEDINKEEIVNIIEMINKKKLFIGFPLPLLQALVQIQGFGFYQLSVIVANSVAKAILGRGLAFAGNAALTRGIAVLAGPIGWAISAILTIPLLTGPAFRVTIPCVIHIAMLRAKYKNK